MSNNPPLPSIHELLGIVCPVKIVDIGASAIDEAPMYGSLLSKGHASIVGFEPDQRALAELNRRKGAKETYLPHAIGDGNTHTLHACWAPGMTSLLKPNQDVLSMFHNFGEFGRVVATHEIPTKRLDDIPETAALDYLKIDIQGAELMVLQHAEERLKTAVVVQVELEFLPMYENQPLFMDVAKFLYDRGFVMHRFETLYSRTLKPVDPYTGLNQLLWGDGIFIRDITKLASMSNEQLLKLSVILHECFRGYDVVLHVLKEHDRRAQTAYAEVYWQAILAAGPHIVYDHRRLRAQ